MTPEEEIAGLKRALEASNQELHDFAYAASHDLQEPLRAVLAYAQLLARRSTDPETAELTATIVDGAMRMTALVQALLSYSRAGKSPRLSSTPLSAPLQVAVYKLTEQIRSSGARVAYGELPEVLIDEAQMEQVFEQLLSNAIRFRSAEAPRVEIAAEEGEDGWIICVKDNGIGVEPQFHESIFEPFKRLHGREVPGAGLGLAIATKIVAAHGGKLWVESDGQNGCQFKMQLPF